MTITEAGKAETTPLEGSRPSRANNAFAGLSAGSATVILVVLAAVATFLLMEA